MCTSVKAQVLEPLSFSEVIQQENASKDELYQYLKQWFALKYRSADDVIQYDDSDYAIIGKGVIPFKVNNLTWQSASGFIRYSLTVRIREGRFKVTFADFAHESTSDVFRAKWSNGLVYAGEELTKDQLALIGVKGLNVTQYRAIDKRVKSTINTTISLMMSDLKRTVPTLKLDNEEDW